ncbi:MAG: CPBP family intramembrane metalloprotease [Clostridiales bacterium]|jgi:membrane protease YdiL (CAAX protease family)|nr:CPBP family intramembrane metalloprotease [Clostridiales bacterium]
MDKTEKKETPAPLGGAGQKRRAKSGNNADAPSAPTEQPSVSGNTPFAQGNTPPTPTEQPFAQGNTPPTPTEQPFAQGNTPPAPTEQPFAQGDTPFAPTSTPSALTEQPFAQGNAPSAPTATPSAQGNTPFAPTAVPSAPTEQPFAQGNAPFVSGKRFAAPAALKKDLKAVWLDIACVTLIALACITCPIDWLAKYTGKNLAAALIRFAFGGAGVVIMLRSGFSAYLKNFRLSRRNAVTVIAALAIAVNNFPVIGSATGAVVFDAAAAEYAAYAAFCLSIGFFEEVFFRGLVFALSLKLFNAAKSGVFKAILTSSLIFGLVHLVNLFGGAGGGAVALQVGYASLTGAVCALLLYRTRSLLWPVLFHTLYDVGGLALGSVASGAAWDAYTITLTALLALAATAYFVYDFIKRPAEETSEQV